MPDPGVERAATARPWRQSEKQGCYIRRSDGAYCAEADSEETAALIVQAVNAHDALVDALRRIAGDESVAMLGPDLTDGDDLALCQRCGCTGETVETLEHDHDCPVAIASAALASLPTDTGADSDAVPAGHCPSRMDGCPCIERRGHVGPHHDGIAFWSDEDADAVPAGEEP